jgi:primosomal protein N' (replication factor Y) (superfamily II helicase)
MTSRNQIAEIFLDLKAIEIDHAFDYKIPDELIDSIDIGIMVVVPFGSRKEIGYVSRLKGKSNLNDNNLKKIDRIIGNITLFDIKKLGLIYWMSFYYIAAIGKIIELFLPPVSKSNLEKFCSNPVNQTKKKLKIIPIINESIVTGDRQHKSVSLININQQKFFTDIFCEDINNFIRKNQHKAFLLEGYLSFYNKTLLFLNICRNTLKSNRKVLILVPEILSAEKLYENFKIDFMQRVCIYHSEMNEKKRFETWYEIWTGKFEVIIGTRSALFTPIKDLGLIIIDDEHDLSYKDSTIVRYNAQDVALRLGKILKIPVVFTSSTPSMNLRFKAENENNFKIIKVTDDSSNKMSLEKVVVDLKTIDRYKDDMLITNTLHKAISSEILSGNKVIVFINKLGFSNFLICTKCGNIPKCPACNLSYRYHKTGKKLICHHCGKEVPYEGVCTACGRGSLSFSGSGIEKVESSLNLRFKDVPIFRIDSEVAGKKDVEKNLLKKISYDGPAIIIGTQMITKDYGIENITLAAVISCDNMLELPDYHMYERVFQMVSQISQKVNGYNKRGKIIIQTFNPENTAIRNFISGSYKDFYLEELDNRKELGYPPYSSLINIIISGSSEKNVKSEIIKLSEKIYEKISNVDFVLLGPVPSPFLKLNIFYRWHIIIKTKEFYKFAVKFGKVMRNFKKIDSIKIIIDVDPVWIL